MGNLGISSGEEIRAFLRKVKCEAVLSYPRAAEAFTAYQRAEFAAESSEFYKASLEFRKAVLRVSSDTLTLN